MIYLLKTFNCIVRGDVFQLSGFLHTHGAHEVGTNFTVSAVIITSRNNHTMYTQCVYAYYYYYNDVTIFCAAAICGGDSGRKGGGGDRPAAGLGWERGGARERRGVW